VQVIKAFGLDESFDFDRLDAYADSVDYFLFDTKTVKHGGSGETFNWDILQKYKGNVPFFLSGGLSIDNLAEVEKIKHPSFYGVDLNSRFEIEPGTKDIPLLKQVFNLLKQPVTP
jgi:phosphoribosylanthranilate isomerase